MNRRCRERRAAVGSIDTSLANRRPRTEPEPTSSPRTAPHPKERLIGLGTARRKDPLPESRSDRLTGPTRRPASRTKRPLPKAARPEGADSQADARDGPGFPALMHPARCDEHHDAKAPAVRKRLGCSSRHHRGPRHAWRGNVRTVGGHAPSRQRTGKRSGAGSNAGPFFVSPCERCARQAKASFRRGIGDREARNATRRPP